jgi:hypothetical protein
LFTLTEYWARQIAHLVNAFLKSARRQNILTHRCNLFHTLAALIAALSAIL